MHGEACNNCMHSKVVLGRFVCDLPGTYPHPVPANYSCEHWDTLDEFYLIGDQEDGRTEESR